MGSKVFDFLTTPLNPCSLEAIEEPIELDDGRLFWLVMISCYQLDDGKRQGKSDLYTVEMPADASEIDSKDQCFLKFGDPFPLPYFETSHSGILDGKWLPQYRDSNTPGRFWCASAHSTGQLSAHCFTIGTGPIEHASSSRMSPIGIKFAGESSLPQSEDEQPLCLSLNWEQFTHSDTNRIVSTYSNGEVAIHDVALSNESETAEIIECYRWKAHTMFSNPAEVWSACFANDGNGNVVLSGGDEGCLKVWDIRSPTLTSPSQTLKPFDAGVTVISQHPRHEHLVACGSYDETMCLFDVRFMSKKHPLFHSEPVGGGIWRIQWHPHDDNRILLAAMHGGCRILQMSHIVGSSNESESLTVDDVAEFTKHESMAYGADWLVWKDADRGINFEAVASCSFYDRAAYIWSAAAANQ